MDFSALALSLRQLQYAVAVADTLSFRAAAALCHTSQPSLSAQIGELERTLGVVLFERNRRRVLVTPIGSAVIERARRVLLEAAAVVGEARRLGDPFTGTLRLGVIPTIAPYLLPEIAAPLRAAFPRLALHWTEDKTVALMHALAHGTLDAALLAREAPLGDVECAEIAADPFVLVTPRRHPLGRSRGPVSPSDLHDAPLLLLDDGHCLRDQALAVCTQSPRHDEAVRATSLATLAQMVSGGAGVTLLPELALALENRRGSLVIRRFAPPVPQRTIVLVWRPSSPLAATLQRVAAAMRKAYPQPA